MAGTTDGEPTSSKRNPTMEDVAQLAGVSRALVSLVMRGAPNVSDRRRNAVLAAAEALDYRPNAVARNLAQKRSNTFGVVLDDLHNTFFADLIDGIHDIAEKHGYRLMLNTAWRQTTDEDQAIESFLEYRVDGIIVLGTRASADRLRGTSSLVPTVVLGAGVDGVDSVLNDDERGAELVVEHLAGLGHTDIVHIEGGNGAGADRRRHGFEHAMRTLGLDPRVVEGDFSEHSGADAVELLLAERTLPTAIFAANDLMAVAAMDRLQHAELRIPEDINIIGYDNTSLAAMRHVSLTTVNQPRREMGRRAAECLIERIEHGRKAPVRHVMSPELIPRSTTGPAPSRRRDATLPNATVN